MLELPWIKLRWQHYTSVWHKELAYCSFLFLWLIDLINIPTYLQLYLERLSSSSYDLTDYSSYMFSSTQALSEWISVICLFVCLLFFATLIKQLVQETGYFLSTEAFYSFLHVRCLLSFTWRYFWNCDVFLMGITSQQSSVFFFQIATYVFYCKEKFLNTSEA